MKQHKENGHTIKCNCHICMEDEHQERREEARALREAEPHIPGCRCPECCDCQEKHCICDGTGMPS